MRIGEWSTRKDIDVAGEFGEKIIHEVTRNPWKLGLLYSDANDPRLVVPNRLHLGWTLNFGHGVAWAMLAGIVGVLAVTRRLRHS